MRKTLLTSLIIAVLLLAGCSGAATSETEKEYKIGVLLSDTGLGDESFNDSAFRGLEKARDELGILFDYREAPDGDFETPLEELAKQGNDLVIGLGFSVQEAIEKTAAKHPDQQFLLIDGVSELNNVTSITFKEHEGSFLVGMVAAMSSKNQKLGIIGGADVPVIHRFEKGFRQGAQYINPEISIINEYANNFGDAQLGRKIAEKQIKEGADFLYPAAGFTGVGAIQASQDNKVFTAGVDSDQYFVAEKAVVTSMMKNIDVAVFDVAESLVKEGKIEQEIYELGLAENGVGLAPIRNLVLSDEQLDAIETAKEKIISGSISINLN
ncbi:BMP family ABC transporter substrate-binding protein [Rossellomorea vietnamensis]|uniref:BMP family ABC transporter substrate-binding protein n=1 Tax=Rossellomorea vietnamensis TaxID=218284 RepID=A0A5D4LZF8_9BACI|nr:MULTISPECIES: BMP family ABC transporter substrate-binding protein [Bacillaceae]TYR94463.1 BMP family ABC transporter substrate-binding protein [Rossellomorea vietnamensis]